MYLCHSSLCLVSFLLILSLLSRAQFLRLFAFLLIGLLRFDLGILLTSFNWCLFFLLFILLSAGFCFASDLLNRLFLKRYIWFRRTRIHMIVLISSVRRRFDINCMRLLEVRLLSRGIGSLLGHLLLQPELFTLKFVSMTVVIAHLNVPLLFLITHSLPSLLYLLLDLPGVQIRMLLLKLLSVFLGEEDVGRERLLHGYKYGLLMVLGHQTLILI